MIRIFKKAWNDFSNLSFVIRARDKSDYRGTGHVLVRDGEALCTDGFRIHIANVGIDIIEDGCYEVVKAIKSEIIINQVEFPSKFFEKTEFEEMIAPPHKDYFQIRFPMYDKDSKVSWESAYVNILIKHMSEDYGVQYELIKDLEPGMIAFIYMDEPRILAFVDDVDEPTKRAWIAPFKLHKSIEVKIVN